MLRILITFLIFLKDRSPKFINRNTGYLLILPSIISIGIMFAGLSYLLYLSLQTYDIFQRFVPIFTLENYYKIIYTIGPQTTYLRTFYLRILASLASVFLAIPYA